MAVDYLDPEQFNNPNEKIDFKYILMRQIDTIRVNRSKEMKSGYNQKKISATSEDDLYIEENTREIYVNSVKSLKMLLIPYSDEMFLTEYNKIKSKFTSFTEKYNSSLLKFEKILKPSETQIKQLERLNKDLNFRYVSTYDNIFELLLRLCQRAKLIGGNNMIADEV